MGVNNKSLIPNIPTNECHRNEVLRERWHTPSLNQCEVCDNHMESWN